MAISRVLFPAQEERLCGPTHCIHEGLVIKAGQLLETFEQIRISCCTEGNHTSFFRPGENPKDIGCHGTCIGSENLNLFEIVPMNAFLSSVRTTTCDFLVCHRDNEVGFGIEVGSIFARLFQRM